MIIPRVSPSFYKRPFAHRGLHDRANGRIENSRKAVQAAIKHGYAIEIDLQLSKDDVVMVFHDYDLNRLCGRDGTVQQMTGAELNKIMLTDGDETIPTFREILDIVAGQVPLLIEFKDQDGKMGPNTGAIEATALNDLDGYNGEYAIMSFNPYTPKWFADNAPEVLRGLVSYDYEHHEDAHIPADHRRRMAELEFDADINLDFISYGSENLSDDAPQRFRASGRPVFCWTIKSAAQEVEALKYCDAVTFEQYLA